MSEVFHFKTHAFANTFFSIIWKQRLSVSACVHQVNISSRSCHAKHQLNLVRNMYIDTVDDTWILFLFGAVRRQCTALFNGLQNRLMAVAIFDSCLVRLHVCCENETISSPESVRHNYTGHFPLQQICWCSCCASQSVQSTPLSRAATHTAGDN